MNASARGILAAVLAILMSSLLFRAIAADAPKGDEWETTSQMTMEGMPPGMPGMPVSRLKVCAAKDRTEPPMSTRENCTNSGYTQEGSKVTWETVCTDPAMTGTGEITFEGTDSYTGTIKFASEQGNMTIRLTGKKLGECNNPR